MSSTGRRRLAAILAADVAGYTRLVEQDTDGTVAAWKAARDGVIKPLVAEKSGRIIKFTGDGFLVEFPSVQDAVACAIALQEKLAAGSLKFRMGLNIGDITDDGGDVHGEGVNIAARLEALAEPGGICISGDVYAQVRNRIIAPYTDLGEREVKHISQPVRVYSIAAGGPEGGVAASQPTARPSRRNDITGKRGVWISAGVGMAMVIAVAAAWVFTDRTGARQGATETASPPPAAKPISVPSRPDKPTIAVLPFNNFSTDKQQDYFSDGLTEDLITDISKISGLAVIARYSTFSYKGQTPDVREVGRALGATHVVEGSVRKVGSVVRITVQLIDAADGRHVWAERYDRNLTDVFAIQDELIGRIVEVLSLKLTNRDKRLLARRGTSNLQAYDAYMRGREKEGSFSKAAYGEARDFYEKAIALDSHYAEAYAHLAQVLTLSAQYGWVDDVETTYRKSLELAETAVEFGPDSPFAHWSLGRILSRPPVTQYGRAIVEFEKAVALDPNYADSYGYLGLVYAYSGHPEKSAAYIDKAMRINPIHPFWYHHVLGASLYLLKDFQGAVKEFTIATDQNSTAFFVREWLAAALAMAGKVEDAEWQISELIGMGHQRTLQEIKDQSPMTDTKYRDLYFTGLGKAGFK